MPPLLADLFLLRRQRHRRRSVLPCVTLRAARDDRIERELVAVAGVGDGLRALHDVQTEVEALRRKMSPMLWPQTITISRPASSAIALEAGRAHLARRSDREAIAGDDERLAAVHAGAEVRHQVAERARLPALVERLEALGHAVGGRRDLIGVDGVEFLAYRVPATSDPRRSAPCRESARSVAPDRGRSTSAWTRPFPVQWARTAS